MEIHLHFSMHRNVSVIHDNIDAIDGVIVPAHILAHQRPSTSAFISSLSADKRYLIDPVTYRLQSGLDTHLNKTGDDWRPTSQKLFAEYHRDLAPRLLENGRLTPDTLPPPSELTTNCLRFQLEAVEEGTSRSAAAKYLKRYAEPEPRRPRVLIPPYFLFERAGDDWYEYSLACAKSAKAGEDAVIAPIILTGREALEGSSLERIVGDYGTFNHVILWVDGYNQTFVTSDSIAVIRGAIQALRGRVARLETHYGGYLWMLSFHDGLSSLAHGILYSEHKSAGQIRQSGQGGAPERYYIPGIRQFRSLSQAERILQEFAELMCDCAVCKEVMGGNPDRFRKFEDQPELLRSHFLQARRVEAEKVTRRSLEEEAGALRKVYEAYHESFIALPNPDARSQDTSMRGLGYLRQWADGITEDIG